MSQNSGNISDNSRRIARNTLFLYFRMLLLLFIGLYTSRVVLKSLGVNDYGVYNAVGGIVALFGMVTNAIASAIARFFAYEIGASGNRMKALFGNAMALQILFSVLLVVLTETIGLWFLNNKMNIPAESMHSAFWVLQCSMGTMILSLLSTPFNALIMSREKMDAFAYISILEAVLKLGVAFALSAGGGNRLILYALLMLAVQFIVRMTYSLYCSSRFAETRGRLALDRGVLCQMLSFAGWNFYGTSMAVANTQGVTILLNIFFGVVVNAARGVAIQIENIVKQFVSNFLVAVNPQITKSFASGQLDYCHELVRKGGKFSTIILMFFIVPLCYEVEPLLDLWLDVVPAGAPLFVKLSLVAVLFDMCCNSLLTLIQATGNVRNYYLATGTTSILIFVLSWLAFKAGAAPYFTYVIFVAVYVVIDGIKLYFAKKQGGLEIWPFASECLLKPMAVALVAAAAAAVPFLLIRTVWLRVVSVFLVSSVVLGIGAFVFCLKTNEKVFIVRNVIDKAGRFLPDALFLRMKYFVVFKKRLHLRSPKTFNEKLQWLKLHDRRPEYTNMVDKVNVKPIVSDVIGEQYVVPTLGVWDTPEQIDWDSLPESFVLKCNHDSGSVFVVSDKSSVSEERKEAIVAGLRESLGHNFYSMFREYPYKHVEKKIFAEQYLGDSPKDYKFMCFGGKVRMSFVCSERGSEDGLKVTFFDLDWNRMPFIRHYPSSDTEIPCPVNYREMIALAEKLSAGIPFVRVDFYEVEGKIYFGEMTFFPGAGFEDFTPEEWDSRIGDMIEI